jgi:ATP-dependent RNA helicase UAP56/SUB2
MIICHTRELAYQIRNEFARFAKFMTNIRTDVFISSRRLAFESLFVLFRPSEVVEVHRTTRKSIIAVRRRRMGCYRSLHALAASTHRHDPYSLAGP